VDASPAQAVFLDQAQVTRKIIILIAVASAAALFFALGLQRYLTFEGLKAQQSEFTALFERRPLLVAGAFMLIHVTALALSLPGAVLTMALAGGAIFGPLWGTIIVLLSLTIGDSMGFLIARHLLRDWVQRRFGRHLETMERGIDKDGPFYLLALRLMAIVPYFVINLTLGLTRMPLKIFAPVSLIGLVPATTLYVNAGTELARIEAPSDVFSARLITLFVLLGLLPLAARFIFARLRPKQGG